MNWSHDHSVKKTILFEKREIINRPNIRDSKTVRIFNIINIFRYFYKCEDKLEILIPDNIKEMLIGEKT